MFSISSSSSGTWKEVEVLVVRVTAEVSGSGLQTYCSCSCACFHLYSELGFDDYGKCRGRAPSKTNYKVLVVSISWGRFLSASGSMS